MARVNEYAYALNAGGVDTRALARIDLQKMRLAGEHPVSNWLPKVLGPMTLRPGWEMLADIPGDSQVRQIRFARSIAQSYVLLMSENEMRVSSGGSIVQVPAVSSTIDATAWTDASSGAAATSVLAGAITLNATATDQAKIRQTVAIDAADQNTDNILRVVVSRGPVKFRVGTTAGAQDVLSETTLITGTHKIAIVPGAASISIQFSADEDVSRSISSVDFESNLIGGAGDLVLPTPWTWAQTQLLRSWQSIDVVYVGDGQQQQRRIEHRGATSWSVSLYEPQNGPYTVDGSSAITMTPGAFTGNTTVTANEEYFQAGHVGTQIELTQSGKTVNQTLNGEDQATDYVTVRGVEAERRFYRTAAGASFVGTLTLQRSVELSDPSVWIDQVTYVDGAATFSRTVFDDGDDNLVAHYRFSIKSGEYTSGSVEVTLDYENATQIGQGLITAVNSSTEAEIETRVAFGNTSSTRSWRIGLWSDVRGWPRVPVIHDDRLHWFDSTGKDFGSEVDDFVDYDDTLEGNSAPFIRTVSGGALEGVVWAQSDQRLVVGTPGFEATIQANDFDGALTPTDYTSRKPSRRGCADIESVSHHAGIFYAQRSERKLYELGSDGNGRYASNNISRLNPEACDVGIVRMAVQLHPETRLYVVLTDGTMVVLTYEVEDEVVAFTTMTIPGGLFEDVCVLPATEQDDVYAIVNRGGQRYHMRLAGEFAEEDRTTCAPLDYHKVLTGSISTIAAPHLASQTVQIWADGQRRADVTLDGSGNGTLDATYSRVVYGLNYDAEFKSSKLAYAAQLGTAIGQEKIVRNIGLVLSKCFLGGIAVGVQTPNETLQTHGLPAKINGKTWSGADFNEHLDLAPFTQATTYDTDCRYYIKASSQEGPVTVQAVVIEVEANETYTPRGG